ncbi:MAG: hypothetical protein K0B15_08535 [Lentimicrobium sp.]|nr:hypothetical protein [Lentimicrobium sp.]
MAHWLDLEEQRHNPDIKAEAKEQFLNRKRQEVLNNFSLISEKYSTFLNDLYQLIKRVNSLPVESRIGFGKIEGRSKNSRLNNYLNIFSSSRRVKKPAPLGFFSFFKRKSFKNIRVAYINVSSHSGMVDIEIKESMIQRVSRKEDTIGNENGKGHIRLEHVVVSVPVEMLDHSFALELIDWFAFKTETTESRIFLLLKNYKN